MAEFFEEIEVSDLITVGAGVTMRRGDLIVVDSGVTSVRFGSGLSGQVLVTNSGTSTNLEWQDFGTALGFLAQNSGDILFSPDGVTFTILSGTLAADNDLLQFNGTTNAPEWQSLGEAFGFTASGQIITSGPGGEVVILGPGAEDQVLTINASGVPNWETPAAGTTDTIIFDIGTRYIVARDNQRTAGYFVWNETEYGAGGFNLGSGELVFHGDLNGGSANIEFVFRLGDVPTSDMISLQGVSEGANSIAVTTPDSSGSAVFEFNVQRTAGTDVNLYGMQLHFTRS